MLPRGMNPFIVLMPGAFREDLLHLARVTAHVSGKLSASLTHKAETQGISSVIPRMLKTELVVTWLMIVDNAAAAILMPLSTYVGVGSFLVSRGKMSLAVFAKGFATTFVYFGMFVYLFDLCNQLKGVEEDTLNKPHRPIPSRLLSSDSARRRVVPVIVMWLVLAIFLNTHYFALTWIAICVTYHKLGSHWFGKNYVMIPIGGMHVEAVPWFIAGVPMSEMPVMRFLINCIVYTTLVHLQDIRDMEGDVMLHRRTLPIILGKDTTRRLYAALSILFLPLLFSKVLPGSFGVLKCLSTFLIVAYSCMLAVFDDNRAHCIAYDMYILAFCVVFGAGAWYRDV